MPLISLCVKGAKNDKGVLSWGRKPAKKKARTSPPKEKLMSSSKDADNEQTGDGANDFHLRTIVHRRLGNEVDPTIMAIINDPNRDILVLFPSDDAMTLEEGMTEIERRRVERGEKAEQLNACNDDTDQKAQQKLVVIFLDATWKYAQEMERANTNGEFWPKDIIRVKLSPPSQEEEVKKDGERGGEKGNAISKSGHDDTTSANFPIDFKPQRFNIRTPPSSGHLSTAECLAWVCAAIENEPSIYEILMRPLDFMVEKWKSFSPDGRGRGKGNFLDCDGVFRGGHQGDEKKGSGRGGGGGGGDNQILHIREGKRLKIIPVSQTS